MADELVNIITVNQTRYTTSQSSSFNHYHILKINLFLQFKRTYICTVCTLTCVYVTKRSEMHKNPHKIRESILAMRLHSFRLLPILNN
jgi:hypothetical protein